MKELSEEELERKEQLKTAIWYTVGKIVDEETKILNTTASPEFTAALADLVFNQAILLGSDLESFANHAKRKVINTDDLLIVCRRNAGLQEVIKEAIEKEKE